MASWQDELLECDSLTMIFLSLCAEVAILKCLEIQII